jgi:hypothetical protein
MTTSYESEPRDFEQWIKEALRLAVQDARPPDETWQLIASQLTGSSRTEPLAVQRGKVQEGPSMEIR